VSGPGQLFPLRPLTVGDVLDGAFRGLRATFRTAAVVILVIQGPYQLLSALLLTRALPELEDPTTMERLFLDGEFEVDVAVRALSLGGGTMIVGLLVQVLVAAALVWLALEADRGRTATVGQSLRESAARMGATLGGTVLVGVVGLALVFAITFVVAALFLVSDVVGVLSLLLVVPAALISTVALFGAYYLVVPAAVAEDRGAWTTFRRAMWVVRNRFWRVVGVMLLLLLVIAAVSIGFSVALGALSQVAGELSWLVDGVSATLTSLVTVPVTTYVALQLYRDARVRLEGYDLEVRAQGLGGS
jgi:hypothetical protein